MSCEIPKVFEEGKCSILKKFFAMIVFASSLLFICGQNNQVEAYWGMVVNCREWISLRSYPSTDAPRLSAVPLGEWIWINRGYYENGFYSAEYNGMHGYVLAAYIRYVKE